MGKLNCADVHTLLCAAVGEFFVLCPTEQGTTVCFMGQNWCRGKSKIKPVSSSLSIKHRSTAFVPSHHCMQCGWVVYYLYLGA